MSKPTAEMTTAELQIAMMSADKFRTMELRAELDRRARAQSGEANPHALIVDESSAAFTRRKLAELDDMCGPRRGPRRAKKG
jgi:hypothetical protein